MKPKKTEKNGPQNEPKKEKADKGCPFLGGPV